MTEQHLPKEWMPSPKRYFLNAPKEEPGTCFVKNDDYVELWLRYEALRRERNTATSVAGRALTELHEKCSAQPPPVALQDCPACGKPASEHKGDPKRDAVLWCP